MTDDTTHTVKGAGLARGPALIIGTILAAFGLILFLHAGATPTSGFPDGDATGEKFLGFESNGWTAFFTTTAGVLLLFGAAQHLLAKTMSVIVGLTLAAAAILALVDGPGVLGLAAANWAVELGWGIAAVLLLLNVFAPRRKKTVTEPGSRGHESPAHRQHADHERAVAQHGDHGRATDPRRDDADQGRNDADRTRSDAGPARGTAEGGRDDAALGRNDADRARGTADADDGTASGGATRATT